MNVTCIYVLTVYDLVLDHQSVCCFQGKIMSPVLIISWLPLALCLELRLYGLFTIYFRILLFSLFSSYFSDCVCENLWVYLLRHIRRHILTANSLIIFLLQYFFHCFYNVPQVLGSGIVL